MRYETVGQSPSLNPIFLTHSKGGTHGGVGTKGIFYVGLQLGPPRNNGLKSPILCKEKGVNEPTLTVPYTKS